MNALLLAAMLLAPADLNAPVTFQGAGTNVLTLVQELSKASGTPMDVAEPRSWPIFARIDKQPVKTVMDQLAKVTDAAWTKRDDGTWVLTRDRSRQIAAVQQETQIRTVQMEKARTRLLESLKDADDWSQAGMDKRREANRKQMEQITKSLPPGVEIDLGGFNTQPAAAMLAKRFVEQVPPATFASFAPGQRTVYSTNPNRYQKTLPFSAGKMLNDFTRAYNIERAAMGERANRFQRSAAIPNGPGKVIFRVTRSGDSIVINITVGDPQGAYVTSYQTSLFIVPDEPTTVASPVDASFDVPASVRSFSQMGSGGAVRAGNSFRIALASESGTFEFGNDQTSSAKREHFATDEPWQMAIGDLYLKAAEKMNRNLLMVPDDTTFNRGFRLFSNTAVTAKQLLNVLPLYDLKSEVDETWWSIRPEIQARADRNRANRAALNKLTGVLLKQGFSGLDDLAAYAGSMPRYAPDDSLDRFWINRLNPMAGQVITRQTAALCFYAALPTQMRRKNGQGPVAQLPGRASAEAFEVLDSSNMMGQRMTVSRQISSTIEMGGNSAPPVPMLSEFELTELLGNAPPDLQFLLDWRNSEAVFARPKEQLGGQFLTPSALGTLLGMKIESIGASGPVLEGPKFDEFAMAWQAQVNLTVKHISGADQSGTLTDGGLAPDAKMGPLTSLPQGVQDTIEERRKRAATMRAGITFGGERAIPPTRG
jgi:hypothetical protein